MDSLDWASAVLPILIGLGLYELNRWFTGEFMFVRHSGLYALGLCLFTYCAVMSVVGIVYSLIYKFKTNVLYETSH